jgi:hypothetical protein
MGESSATQSPDFLHQLKELADTIKASADAIKAVESTLSIFQRSAVLEINNTSGRELVVLSVHHDHGDFSAIGIAPGQSIAAKSTTVLGTGSTGILVGTEGNIVLSAKGTDIQLTLNWIVPFLGFNASDLFLNSGADGDKFFVMHNLHGSGNTNVPFRYMIGEKIGAANRQVDWRKCRKCKTLYFSPQIEASICPAGGLHEHDSTDFNYRLPHDVAGLAHQSDWRHCSNCKGIFFNGDGHVGLCFKATPPTHNFGVGYRLAFSVNLAEPASPQHENGFRTCINCFALFRDRHQRGCPSNSGGMHTPFPESGALPPGHKLSSLPDKKPFNYSLFLQPSPLPSTHEGNWAVCEKCDTLFSLQLPVEANHCQQGGGHVANIFEIFAIEKASANPEDELDPTPGIQKRWTGCKKCSEMVFGAFRARGTCTVANAPGFALDGHNPVGFNYSLEHDVTGPGQDGWRFCNKCNQLAFEPENGSSHCAGGGQHVLQGSNFRLEH